MFTGIVQGMAKILAIKGSDHLKTITIGFPQHALDNLSKGASIAINGVCLTATHFDGSRSEADFDVMQETLRVTNIGTLNVADDVNFERAASFGKEIGGHLMSGHVHTTVPLTRRVESDQGGDNNVTLFFACPAPLRKYLMPKGFVGLNGCSLTLGEQVTDEFSVHLIPETFQVTTFGQAKPGDPINLEIDPSTQAIVDTVERYLGQRFNDQTLPKL